MWSEYALEVVDAVARGGSFSAAVQELYRVPSAISYTGGQLEAGWRSRCLSASTVRWY